MASPGREGGEAHGASDTREGRLASVAGAVLLGGASERMGRDKAGLLLAGESLAARAARLLEPLLEDVLLVGGEAPADAPGRRVPDVEGPRCALRGLVSALSAARSERVLVVATDLPLLTPAFVLGLLARSGSDAVVPRTPDGAQPLCAVYRREPVLAVARARLARRALALHELLDELAVDWIEGADLRALDPGGRALLNVNTRADLVRARERVARG